MLQTLLVEDRSEEARVNYDRKALQFNVHWQILQYMCIYIYILNLHYLPNKTTENIFFWPISDMPILSWYCVIRFIIGSANFLISVGCYHMTSHNVNQMYVGIYCQTSILLYYLYSCRRVADNFAQIYSFFFIPVTHQLAFLFF